MVSRTLAAHVLLACSLALGAVQWPRAARADIEVVDDAGRRVRLAAPARRIVSLSPHLTELLFQAGAGTHVVGAAAFSDFPLEAQAVPRIGDARGLDVERILGLGPDLVVAWGSGNSRRTIDRLRRLGLQVFESEPARLDDIARTVVSFGVLAGTEAGANRSASEFRAKLQGIAQTYRQHAALRVFYQIWDRPLLTVNGGHFITDALAACGASNAFGSMAGLTAAPSREAVLLADPDAIVVATLERGAVAGWLRWPALRASRHDRVIAVDPAVLHRPTLRIVEGIDDLCRKLHRA